VGRFSSWMNNAATDFEGFSRWLTKLFKPGIATGLNVTQRGAGANMSVDIQVGDGMPMRTNDGAWSWITAVENVTIGAASANNRRDIVVKYVDMSVTNPSTSTPNNPGAVKFMVVQGTPASSPSDPSDSAIQAAVGASNPYEKLARVSLTSSTTQITNAQITDLRRFVALNVQRLWGGSSNTLGHLVPNQADGTVVTTTDTGSVTNAMLAGSIAFSKLLSTIFGDQVQTQANAGTGGGTINYLNLGGIKLMWGVTGPLATNGVGQHAFTVIPPTSFFTTAPKVFANPTSFVVDTNQHAQIGTVTTSSIQLIIYNITGSGGAGASINYFAIGT
jgi:hypothetical protein